MAQNTTTIVLRVGATPVAVACLTGNGWEATSDVRETSCKDTNGHKTHEYGLKSWTMTAEGYINFSAGATSNPKLFWDAMQGRTKLTVEMGSGTTGEPKKSGTAVVTAYSESYDGVEDNATFSISLQGDGAMTWGTYA